MNKLKKTIYTIVCSLTFVGCHNLLDVEPYSVLTDDNYFQDVNDVKSATTGVYDVLSDKNSGLYWGELIIFDMLSTDEAYTERQNEREVSEFLYNPSTKYVEKPWQGSYKLINRANKFIEKVEVMDSIMIDQDEKRRYLGEVRFLRALNYFNLVRHYNEVPLRLHSATGVDDTHVPVSKAEDVYKVIIADLDSAIASLPNHFGSGDLGRADKAAALALKSKVYLTMAGYPLFGGEVGQTEAYTVARDLARDIIDNQGDYELGLWEYYGDEFETVNDNGQEDIFCVQFSSTVGLAPTFEGANIHKETFKGTTKQGIKYDGKHTVRPSKYIKEAITKNDARGDLISNVYYINGKKYTNKENNKKPNLQMFHKWIDQEILDGALNAQVSNQDWKIFRLAEMYLIAAEAENELNGPTEEAYTWINTIRERARNDEDGIPVEGAVPDLEGLDQAGFRKAVLDERLIELHAEGKRWYDLVRTQTFEEQIEAAMAVREFEFPNQVPEGYFLPIPYEEYVSNDSIDYVN